MANLLLSIFVLLAITVPFLLLERKPKRKQPCQHLNYDEKFWTEPDGTNMVQFRCCDCGYSDRGCLHGG